MAKDETRAKILDAAGAAFADRGYEKATIREIASLAGVNLASVNYHFGDKEQLYLETIRSIHRSKVEQAPFPNWPADTLPEIKLHEFVLTILTRMLATDELSWQARLITREMLQPTGICRKLVESFVRPQHELLLSILGELTPQWMPQHQQEQFAFSVLGQCAFYRFHREVIRMVVPQSSINEHYCVAPLANHITRVTLAALGDSSISRQAFMAEGLESGTQAP